MAAGSVPLTTLVSPQHGESEYNQMGKIGGNSRLSARGEQYSEALADYIHSQVSGTLSSIFTRGWDGALSRSDLNHLQ